MWDSANEGFPFRMNRVGSRFQRPGLTQVAKRPHTLLITCTAACSGNNALNGLDSQEVVLMQSAANVVSAAWAVDGRVTRAVEKAITSGVKDVVVCGHSYCKSLEERLAGECAYSPSGTLAQARTGRSEDFMQNMFQKMRAAAVLLDQVRQNVVTQLQNLESYPPVSRALAHGAVRLHGWVYLDQSGMIVSYDFRRGEFVPLADHPSVPPGLGQQREDWPSM